MCGHLHWTAPLRRYLTLAMPRARLWGRNRPRKFVWRAEIILAREHDHGSFGIMRRAETSRPMLWYWQQRHLGKGIAGLKQDKTRPSQALPLPHQTLLRVMAKMVQASPLNAVH